MEEKMSKERALLFQIDYVMDYWNDGIFSDEEAVNRIAFHTQEYLTGTKK